MLTKAGEVRRRDRPRHWCRGDTRRPIGRNLHARFRPARRLCSGHVLSDSEPGLTPSAGCADGCGASSTAPSSGWSRSHPSDGIGEHRRTLPSELLDRQNQPHCARLGGQLEGVMGCRPCPEHDLCPEYPPRPFRARLSASRTVLGRTRESIRPQAATLRRQPVAPRGVGRRLFVGRLNPAEHEARAAVPVWIKLLDGCPALSGRSLFDARICPRCDLVLVGTEECGRLSVGRDVDARGERGWYRRD